MIVWRTPSLKATAPTNDDVALTEEERQNARNLENGVLRVMGSLMMFQLQHFDNWSSSTSMIDLDSLGHTVCMSLLTTALYASLGASYLFLEHYYPMKRYYSNINRRDAFTFRNILSIIFALSSMVLVLLNVVVSRSVVSDPNRRRDFALDLGFLPLILGLGFLTFIFRR